MLRRLLGALALALMPLTAAGQPMGGGPELWFQSGPAISTFDPSTCVTVPSTVTGGCMGAGTINATGLFVGGASITTPPLTVGTTQVQNATPSYLLYNNAGILGELQYIPSNSIGQLIIGTGAAAGASGVGSTTLTAIGTDAGAAAEVTGSGTFIGHSAGKGTSVALTGGQNVCVGASACYTAQGSMGSATYVGFQAGMAARGSANNTAVGALALQSGQGNNNVAIGFQAYLYGNGANNVFIGRASAAGAALPSLLTNALSPGGGSTIFFADTSALATGMMLIHANILPGTKITAITAGVSVTLDTPLVSDIASGQSVNYLTQHTGINNVGIGYLSLQNIAGTAEANTAVGQASGRSISTGLRNTAIGVEAMGTSAAISGNDNTAVGWQSLANLGSGAQNTAVGVGALTVHGSFPLTGNNNTVMGYRAARLLQSASQQNTIIGSQAALAITTANDNTFLGYNAGTAVTSGSTNVLIGSGTAATLTTGSNNIIIGPGLVAAGGTSNTLNIGGAITGTGLGSAPLIAVNGLLTANATAAIGAGANTQAMIRASSTANFGLYYGTGDPSFTAAKGSLYIKTDATTTTTRFWINTNGSTTWAAFTSSS